MPAADEPHLIKRRRHLPHWELAGSVYFITFRSARGPLPPEALKQVMTNILHDHARRYTLHFAVVMPDHVHLLLEPLRKSDGSTHTLSEINKGIKGASACSINKLIGATGPVWQEESFDRIMRDEDEYREKWEYMWKNPMAAGLVADPDDYEYFVRPPK